MTVEYIWIQGENGSTMMAKQPQADPKGLFGDKGMTFKDAIDIINPLQQIPIISSIYRELTGDTISPGARLAGGMLYGLGVLGAIGAAASNAVEETTGHDPGATMMAMIRGESLGDQIQTAQAGHDKASKQLASAQYYSGGADPIDPTSLPAGAKLVDLPPAGPDNSQLAAAAPSVAAVQTAANPPAASPVAAPTDAVSITALPPLPPTINPVNSAGGSATAGDGNRVPAMPTTPAGITGLSAHSHLPTAGSITPPGAALTAATTQSDLTPPSNGPNIPLPTIKAPAAAADQATRTAASGLPLTKTSEGFPIPARTNNMTPRMPVAQTPANVGTQPLALSTAEHRSANVVPAAAPAAAPSSTPIAIAPASAEAAATASPAVLPPAQVPDAMMRALDKYDALMRTRRGANGQVDQTL